MQDKTFEGVADTLYIPLAARVYVSKRFPEPDELPDCSTPHYDGNPLQFSMLRRGL